MSNSSGTTVQSKFRNLSTFLLGIVAFFVWELTLILVSIYMDPGSELGSQIFLPHVVGLGVLALFMFNDRLRLKAMGSPSFQLPNRRISLYFVGAVVGLYASFALIGWLLEIPPEPFMMALMSETNIASWIFLLMATILVAPIAEELMFRGVILGIFNFKNTLGWRFFSVCLSAVVFVALHIQYEHITTFILLIFLSLMLGTARIISNGLILPVAMHSVATLSAWLFFALLVKL